MGSAQTPQTCEKVHRAVAAGALRAVTAGSAVGESALDLAGRGTKAEDHQLVAVRSGIGLGARIVFRGCEPGARGLQQRQADRLHPGLARGLRLETSVETKLGTASQTSTEVVRIGGANLV